MSLEYCCECDEPTGNAGRGDDSLYVGEIGPLCHQCLDDLIDDEEPIA